MASHSFSYTPAVTLMFSTVEWTVVKTIPLKIFCFFLTNTMKDKACVTLPAFFLHKRNFCLHICLQNRYLRLQIVHLSASMAILYCFKSLLLTAAFIVDERFSLQGYYKTFSFLNWFCLLE